MKITKSRKLNRAGQPRQPGFSLITVTVLVSIILAFGLAIVSVAIGSGRLAKNYASAINAVQIADAGASKALFCLRAQSGENCGGQYGDGFTGEADVEFSGGTYSSTVSAQGNDRLISVNALDAAGQKKEVSVVATTEAIGESLDWDYAVQVDGGGLVVENNAVITDGPVHSKSSIDCSNNAVLDQDVFVSLLGGYIDNCTINGDAHADSVTDCDMNGNDVYYRDSIHKTKDIGMTYPNSPTPDPVDMPSIDLDYWRQAAADGGTISGNYSPSDNESLGPVKIDGDLNLGNNVDVTMTGPIWVTGDILFRNNSTLTLDSGFSGNSTVLLADNPTDPDTFGHITVQNNAEIDGSGEDTSFILVVSTNTSLDDGNPAISLYNNAGGSLFLAPNGAIRVKNNASATALSANRIYIDQNGLIDFESLYHDPSDLSLTSEPGASWHFKSGTWRETAQ